MRKKLKMNLKDIKSKMEGLCSWAIKNNYHSRMKRRIYMKLLQKYY